MDPRASCWASGERERLNVDGHKKGGQSISVSVRSTTPSHTQTLSKPFRTFAIKWEVNTYKEVFLRAFITVSLWCCRWQYNTMTRSQVESYQILKKMVFDAFWLNTQHYKVRVKGKCSNSGKRIISSPTPQCSAYWKGSLRVTLDYSRPIYLLIDFN